MDNILEDIETYLEVKSRFFQPYETVVHKGRKMETSEGLVDTIFRLKNKCYSYRRSNIYTEHWKHFLNRGKAESVPHVSFVILQKYDTF